MVKSEKWSLKGWKFSEWVKGNANTIIEVVKVGGPFLLSLQFVAGNEALVTAITLGGKFVLDVVHYFSTSQK